MPYADKEYAIAKRKAYCERLVPPSVRCSFCDKEFIPKHQQRKNAIRSGVFYCSKECSANGFRKKIMSDPDSDIAGFGHVCGPCLTCGQMYRSRTRNKLFCTIKCYLDSDQFKERSLAECRKNITSSREKAGIPIDQEQSEFECLACGQKRTIPNSRRSQRFCNKRCTRKYFSDRFDRWVANPETVALPQCYDEFLCHDELPCLFKGCNWSGKNLGIHVNHVHGVSADDFKQMAGFNRRTGLVTPDLSESLANNQGAKLAALGIPRPDVFLPPNRPNVLRLEGKEHAAKGRALALSSYDGGKVQNCRYCGTLVEQPLFGVLFYCSKKHRSKYYGRKRFRLTCSQCSNQFDGDRRQQLCSDRGGKVCCSDECRNAHNITICHTKRRLRSIGA